MNTEKPAAEAMWIDAALRHRPEIQSKLLELQALGDDLRAAEFSPFAGSEVGVHTEHDPEWRTGPTITVPLPIFDWGQAARSKIMAQRVAARHELSGAQADIIEEVRVAYAAYMRARQTLADANEKFVPLLKRSSSLIWRIGLMRRGKRSGNAAAGGVRRAVGLRAGN